MENNYKKIASKVYDATKGPGVSIDGDIEFYISRLIQNNGKVLEAGVGNGRFLIPLMRKGIDIDGIDISQEMLEICENNTKKYQLDPKLYCGDLNSFKFEYKYESIIMPNGTMCLMDDLETVKNILLNFKENLLPEGKIYLDLIFPSSFKAGNTSKSSLKISEKELIEILNFSKEINWYDQYTITEFEYRQFMDKELIAKEKQNFKLIWFGVQEFEQILKSLGFNNIEIIKNYGINKMLNLKNVTFIFN